jgi:UDP-N-acetylmuramoyl-tripeptide--D-alanyl-D-alanine ligase
VQGDARYLLDGALAAGLSADRGRFFSTAEAAGDFAAKLLHKGDVVLIKGSRGVRLERVVELISQASKEQAAG